MKAIVNKTALLFILLDNLYFPINIGFDFRVHYLLYFLFILYFLITHKTLHVRLNAILGLVALFFALSLVPLLTGEGMVVFAKQASLILFNLIFSFLLINAYKFDLIKLFKDYIDLIFIAAIVGAIQICSQLVGFRYGADYSYLGFDMFTFTMENLKIQSWFQEPSFLAVTFLPVIFICLSRFFSLTEMISFGKSIFITLIFILSQSSVGLIGLVLSLIIIIISKYSILRKPHLVGVLFVLVSFLCYGFYSIPQVQLRIDDSSKLFFGGHMTKKDIDKTNLSTYALFSNYKVTFASLMDHPFVGTGLGTYESTYDKYINEVIPKSELRDRYPLNKKDADSLLFRIATELGLFGLIVLGIFLIKNRIRLNLKTGSQWEIDFWIMNSAVLVLIYARLLRQGHYTVLGFTVFILIYFYTKKQFALHVNSLKN
jgi:hypothetical protein